MVGLLDKKERYLLTVFLSGGMTGLTHDEMTGWRERIKRYTKFYDIKVISPTDYFMCGYDYLDEPKESFTFDTYWVRHSDVIIANMNKPNSIGTAQELMLAYELNKPIIVIANKERWEKEVNTWIKCEATTVFFYDDYDDEEDLYEDVVDYAVMYE